MVFSSLTRFPALAVVAAVLLGTAACDIQVGHDPAKTVTVEISGIDSKADRESVLETLQGMTDGSSYSMSSFSSGDETTVKLSPVRDVEAFSRKINFGEVTEVEGRTVKVEFVP